MNDEERKVLRHLFKFLAHEFKAMSDYIDDLSIQLNLVDENGDAFKKTDKC